MNEKQIEVKIQNKRIKIKADINQMLLNWATFNTNVNS